jgi:hydroxyacylglutathione hydrolase
MIFERIRSEGLAHISYFIGSGEEAAIIDPRRDCHVYLSLAKKKRLKIKYIFETHCNEDYAIGSVELTNLTPAKVYHGPGLKFKYGETLKDGQEFYIDTLKLTAIHTPGHTDESMSYVLTDPSAGKEAFMVFTGDTLFVGDVGRTDLYGPDEAPRLSGNLYDSIFNKILPLGDGVILCPAHSGGSVCGKAISKREESTLGLERIQNQALEKRKKEDFVKFKVAEQHERPPYFRMMEKYNLEGPPLLWHLPRPSPLTPVEFQKRIESGAVVLDTRMPPAFGGAHIKGSYNVWLTGIPSYAGWVLPYDKPILLVVEDMREVDEAVRYLVRLGYDKVEGFLCDALSCTMEAWYNRALPVEHTKLLTVQELKELLTKGEDLLVLDVRSDGEWEEFHIEGATHIYVGHLQEHVSELPKDKPIAVLCNVGRRSSLGTSILLRNGFRDVYNVLGSMTAWRNAGYPVTK